MTKQLLRGIVAPLAIAILIAAFLHYKRSNSAAVFALERAIYASDIVRQEVGVIRSVWLKPGGNVINEYGADGRAKLNVLVVGESRSAAVEAEMRKSSGSWDLEEGRILSHDDREIPFGGVEVKAPPAQQSSAPNR